MFNLLEECLVEDELEKSKIISEEDYKTIRDMCLEHIKTIESKDEIYVCLFDGKAIIMLQHTSTMNVFEDSDSFIAILGTPTEEDKEMPINKFLQVEEINDGEEHE